MAAPADAQRERAVALLTRAYAEGRLDHDDFEMRTERALTTRSSAELMLQLRGLLVEDVGRRARRLARIAGIGFAWISTTVFLLITFIVAVAASGAAAWTLVLPLAWLAVTLMAVRAARR
jgi:hypothetical protein